MILVAAALAAAARSVYRTGHKSFSEPPLRASPRPTSADPSNQIDAGSGTGVFGTAPIGPVFPLFGLPTSATKTTPRLFGAVRSVITALATWNLISFANAE